MKNWEVIRENQGRPSIKQNQGRPSIKRLPLCKNVSLDLVYIQNLDEWTMTIRVQTESMTRFDIQRDIELTPLDGPNDWEHMQEIAESAASFWLKELAGRAIDAFHVLDA